MRGNQLWSGRRVEAAVAETKRTVSPRLIVTAPLASPAIVPEDIVIPSFSAVTLCFCFIFFYFFFVRFYLLLLSYFCLSY